MQFASILHLNRHSAAAAALFVALSALAVFGFARKAQALTFSPVRIEMSGNPGEVMDSAFKVFNDEREAKTYYVVTENFEARDESGNPTFISSKTGLSSWISVPKIITLAPGERKMVPFQVHIPKNIEPGGYFAGVLVALEPPEDRGAGKIALGSQTGPLILFRVNGNISENSEVLEFATINKQRVFSSLPVGFYYRFQNSGADRVKPQGLVRILNTFRMTSKDLIANRSDGSVLPKSIRRFETWWLTSGGGKEDPLKEPAEQQPSGFFQAASYQWRHFALGMYTARLELAYGEQVKQGVIETYTFFVFPWQLLVIILGGLVVAWFILKFGLRRYNNWVIAQAQKRR